MLNLSGSHIITGEKQTNKQNQSSEVIAAKKFESNLRILLVALHTDTFFISYYFFCPAMLWASKSPTALLYLLDITEICVSRLWWWIPSKCVAEHEGTQTYLVIFFLDRPRSYHKKIHPLWVFRGMGNEEKTLQI